MAPCISQTKVQALVLEQKRMRLSSENYKEQHPFIVSSESKWNGCHRETEYARNWPCLLSNQREQVTVRTLRFLSLPGIPSSPYGVWNLVADLVVGSAEQHQTIRIAIRQGPGALGGASIVRAGCVCVSKEDGGDAMRLSGQSRRRGRSGWPCRRAPPPSSSRDDTAAGSWAATWWRLCFLCFYSFFISPRFIYQGKKKRESQNKTPTIHSFHPTLI